MKIVAVAALIAFVSGSAIAEPNPTPAQTNPAPTTEQVSHPKAQWTGHRYNTHPYYRTHRHKLKTHHRHYQQKGCGQQPCRRVQPENSNPPTQL